MFWKIPFHFFPLPRRASTPGSREPLPDAVVGISGLRRGYLSRGVALLYIFISPKITVFEKKVDFTLENGIFSCFDLPRLKCPFRFCRFGTNRASYRRAARIRRHVRVRGVVREFRLPSVKSWLAANFAGFLKCFS